ncbi:MAG TPA: hypothetical protein VMX58_00050 [Patescibacteria group bacterium]|nr:hypothetical protein [Patescibacteria group bacterium]
MEVFLGALEADPGPETTIYRTGDAGVSVSIAKKQVRGRPKFLFSPGDFGYDSIRV